MSATSTPASAGADGARILTVPNVITVVRLCCIPLFLWLLFSRDNRVAAGFLLGGLGATDWIDGFIARRFDQVSELGKILDPTADRLLFIVCVSAIIADGSAPRWFAVVVVCREALLGVVLVVLYLAGMKRFDVTWWGKTGTFLLMFAFPGFMLGASTIGIHTAFQVAAWIMGLPGLAISLYAAVTYVPMMRTALVEGRSERRNPKG